MAKKISTKRIEINIGRGMSYSEGNNLFAFAKEELHYDEIVYVVSHSILSPQGGARVYNNQNGDGQYSTLEELAVAMKKISGNLSLWKIADSTSAVMADEDEDDFSISDLEYKINDRVVAEKILQSPKDGNVVIKVGALGTIKQLRKSYAPYGVAFDDVDGLFYVSDLDIGLWEISEE